MREGEELKRRARGGNWIELDAHVAVWPLGVWRRVRAACRGLRRRRGGSARETYLARGTGVWPGPWGISWCLVGSACQWDERS